MMKEKDDSHYSIWLNPHEIDGQKRLLIDLDGVLADWDARCKMLPDWMQEQFKNKEDLIPCMFENMPMIQDAKFAYDILVKHFNVYICSTPSWFNPYSFSSKVQWCKQHLGPACEKRLILTHNKGIVQADFLVDDLLKNATGFQGEFIHFGSEQFSNWKTVCDYLLERK